MTLADVTGFVDLLRSAGVEFLLLPFGFHFTAPRADLEAAIRAHHREIDAFLRLEAFSRGLGFCTECYRPTPLASTVPARVPTQLGHAICEECDAGVASLARIAVTATRATGTTGWISLN